MKVKSLRALLHMNFEDLNGLLCIRAIDRYDPTAGEKSGLFRIERSMHSRAGKGYIIVWKNGGVTYYTAADVNNMVIDKEETIVGIFNGNIK